jgi:hypothetical protein
MSAIVHRLKMNEYRNYAYDLDAFMQPLCTDVAYVLHLTTSTLRDLDMARLNANVATELQRGRNVVDARALDEAHNSIGEALRDAAVAHRQLFDAMIRVADSVDNLRSRCIVNRQRTFEERFDDDSQQNEVIVSAKRPCRQCSVVESELVFDCDQCGGLQMCMRCGVDYVYAKSDNGRSHTFPCWDCEKNTSFAKVGRMRRRSDA